ncbi:glycosyl hydrolase family 28-related protein [uncultured Litoreibacter sp.]|uniref:glycosyl hydrolase family 28-related protein n=1 Tax=uncultured Litoreibacter sp. TaxID=1392394 RepID=UPI00260F5AE3|nr:glycosyl hydrolase family 28-related protein [uncultured Litoreibacter sp.]
MNKAITEGLVLTPPAFANGLDMWSRGDGTPGTPTYDGFATAAYVPADQDFGGCLEILKTENTQNLRYMGETPLLPGCYLQIKARVKAISGNLPTVRIAAFAGGAGGAAVPGVMTTGPATPLTGYGDVVEVTAIVGTGSRAGVTLPWGTQALYGHFGLDLTGSNGGVVRIDDIEITDITSAFLRTMMDWVDVADYGAVGDGTTDNAAAFEAADAAANGREVVVPEGVYFLGDSVTFENRVRFRGTVAMPDDKYLALNQNFDFDAYAHAFGDEVLGFKKAFQALLKQSSHESLDLCGRSIGLREPIDMQACVPDVNVFSSRRVIRNGQFDAIADTAWDTDTVTSSARYLLSDKRKLTNVTNVANIAVGSLVIGAGVGREVYVTDRNVAAQTLDISEELYDAVGTQNYTFKRFKYLLDFSGFEDLAQFNISDVDFRGDGHASCVMISKQGLIWHFRDCYFNKPLDRGLTSIGRACQGMMVDRCQFISNEQPLLSQDREVIGMNINANDAKIRNNRAIKWGHWAVVHGSGHMFAGNHWFQGDNEPNGTRKAGLVLTRSNSKIIVNGNYIDNNFIEWNNEHDAEPDQSNELSFGSLSIVGNIFTCARVGPWFRWIVIKPFGPGHFINGLTVSGNTFKALDGSIDRVDMMDDSIAALDFSRTRNIEWTGNTYHSVDQWTASPAMLQFTENTEIQTWTCDFTDWMPFGGRVRNVTGVVADGPLRNAGNVKQYATPYSEPEKGTGGGQVWLTWPSALKGKVNVVGRMDNPF